MNLFGFTGKWITPTQRKKRLSKVRNHEWAMQDSVKWVAKKHASNFPSTKNSFHKVIGSALEIATIFSIFPVSGATSNRAADIKFKWMSIKTVYSWIMFCLTFVYSTLTVYKMFNDDLEFDPMITAVFYMATATGSLLFLRLAAKWPELMQQWELVDAEIPKWRHPQKYRRLAFRARLLIALILSFAFAEHTLSIFSSIRYTKDCLNQTLSFEEYGRGQSSQLFEVVNYSTWAAVIGKVINIIATFVWNFMDLFIILVSIGLTSMFKRMNEDLYRIKGENMNGDFWESRRLQYRRLSKLCAAVDSAISSITLVSFFNNLFFICVQLLKSLTRFPLKMQIIYFWFSTIFLMTRTLAVCLYSAEIHEESKKPIAVLRAAPNISWCTEAQRLFENVKNDTIALSGRRFFFITRQVIPSIAKTIVTYALVLIQMRIDDTQEEIVCQKS